MSQFDWIAALSSQDKSIESELARRDLSKKLALLQNVTQAKVGNEERQREFNERQADTQARMAETRRLADEREGDRKTAEERLRFNTEHDNFKPGDRVSKTRNADVMERANKFGAGGQFSPAADNPDELIYQEKVWKQAQLDHEFATKEKAEQAKRAKEDQARQEKQFALQEKADKRAEDASNRSKQNFDAKIKGIEAKEKQLSPAGVAKARQLAAIAVASFDKNPGFFGSPEETAAKRTAVADAEYDKVLADEQKAKHGGVDPRSLLTPSGDYLTPEEMKANPHFANLPPGTKVKRLQ